LLKCASKSTKLSPAPVFIETNPIKGVGRNQLACWLGPVFIKTGAGRKRDSGWFASHKAWRVYFKKPKTLYLESLFAFRQI